MMNYSDELDEFWTIMDEYEKQELVDRKASDECWDKWFPEEGEGTHGIGVGGMTLNAVASYMNDYDYYENGGGKVGDWIIEQVQDLYDEEFKERAEKVIERYENICEHEANREKEKDHVANVVAELSLKGGLYEEAGVLLANRKAPDWHSKNNLKEATVEYNAVQKIFELVSRKTVAETQARWQQG